MSMSGDIRQALVDSPLGLSREALFAQSGAPDDRKFGALLSQLKGVGKIKVGGTRGGEDYFVLDDWPESALRDNFDTNRATQRRISAKEFAAQGGDGYAVEPKNGASGPERAPRKKRGDKGGPEAPPAPTVPITAQFAISAQGELGIEKDDAKIRLTRAELVALLAFTEKTEEVWKG